MSMQTEVFKFQRPLMSPGPAKVLVYNQSRKIMLQIPLDNYWQKTFGKQFKFYAKAEYNPDKQSIRIVKFLPPQNW